MKTSQRWVIKAGSQMVCEGGMLLIKSWMAEVARLRRDHGVESVWVTSGAIASAAERTGSRTGSNKRRTLAQKQALSAIGQPMVMDMYNLAIQAAGGIGAQILLTSGDLKDAKRRSNFVNAAGQLLRWGALPVLNENDAVATEEIKFGDNDRLSAEVAAALKADRLVILTDVEGLHAENPKKNPGAELIATVEKISAPVMRMAGVERGGSERGTGGMYSKLLAARIAQRAGIATWLVKGDRPHVLRDLARGRHVGTKVEVSRVPK